jgi:hypothetical protein
MATKAKRPKFKINDRVMLASYTPLVPAYGGKPFLGRGTVLRVSSITGTGALRNPYFVHVTDGEGHFWQFPPDDVVPAGEGTAHATRSAPRKYGKRASEKVRKTMHEFKRGKLRGGGGGKVTSRKQAIAIGLAQARAAGGKVPRRPHHASRRRYPYIGYFNGEPVYVLGTTTRADEGIVGHDLRVRPVRLGKGPYTVVVDPDDVRVR